MLNQRRKRSQAKTFLASGLPSSDHIDFNGYFGQVSMKYFILLTFLLSGCATVKCKDSIVVDIQPNAPSEVSLRCQSDTDPRFVATADSAIKFTVVCPEGIPQGSEVGGIPCVSK